MYIGFDLKTATSHIVNKRMVEIGKGDFDDKKKKVEAELEDFLNDDRSIDGTALQTTWFPSIDADVFISHSHNDLEQAYELAGFLKHNFGLKVFLDSCVWGSADGLLKEIDDKYCEHPTNTGSYSYEARNFSTSHVHMMLSAAIHTMIDKSECLFFLNTPNSISAKDVINQQTKSPWIYAEILMSQLVRREKPCRVPQKVLLEKSAKPKLQLDINYKLDMRHLAPLNYEDLLTWQKVYEKSIPSSEVIGVVNSGGTVSRHDFAEMHALDVLYRQQNLIETNR
ncbi:MULTISPECIES: toll/interleukin-1 receptor domain-containing protein [Bacillus cereus group]|uniref:toll/interleukin-1 receptor domain-containing protein n=1 Tax=Bacillus cereus group TaxID=86661 RepID=UPI001F591666|nr:toll/interleukin-1 receptor domain-containing protein [Bacillus cereus]